MTSVKACALICFFGDDGHRVGHLVDGLLDLGRGDAHFGHQVVLFLGHEGCAAAGERHTDPFRG